MATGKESAKQPEGLQSAVEKAVGQAQDNVQTGNVATVKETAAQPAESLATGTRRSHPAE